MPSSILLVLYLLLNALVTGIGTGIGIGIGIGIGTGTGTVPSTALPPLDHSHSNLGALRCYTVLPYVTFITIRFKYYH